MLTISQIAHINLLWMAVWEIQTRMSKNMLFSWSYLKTEFKTQEETLSLNVVLKLLKTSWLKQLNCSLRYFIFKYNNTKINVLSTKPCFLIVLLSYFFVSAVSIFFHNRCFRYCWCFCYQCFQYQGFHIYQFLVRNL